MSADMPGFTAQPWELRELPGALADWTGARFVILAPNGAPGGIGLLFFCA